HPRFVHAIEELPHVGAERLDVTSLALGVDRFESQARFSRAARAGENRQFAERKIEIYAFEIVLTGPANLNASLLRWSSDAFFLKVELGQIEIVQAGQPADRRFERAVAAFTTVDDPLENTHVIAETGPEKFPTLTLAEPIHIEDQRRIGKAFSNGEPVPKI